MSKRQIIILLAVVIILLPFLGFTSSVDKIILIVVGLLIIAVAYKIPVNTSDPKILAGNAYVKLETPKESNLPFVEHNNLPE
jgi:hypothetical protein